MQRAPFRTRIAPTPSGFLHPGNAFSFVLTWVLARRAGGEILLRIDDLDAARSRPEYVEDIFQSLDWLGIDYDLGPSGPDDFAQHYSQHHRMELYRTLLERLKGQAHVYACTCSRKQIRALSAEGLYPGTCRELGLPLDQEGAALRIHVPESTAISFQDEKLLSKEYLPARLMGDFVLWRKDGLPAYQLASLADDLHYQVNYIVRGADLIESTVAQLFLADCLEESAFTEARFWHHDLLRDEVGDKLSKSAGAASLKAMRERGEGPVGIYMLVAEALGLSVGDVERLDDLLGSQDSIQS